MNITAIIPGSFDPVTIGHTDVIERAAKLFDKVYVTVFVNSEKKPMFSLEERCEMLRIACEDIPNVTVESCDYLLADYAKEKGATVLVKGIRGQGDVDYEFMLAKVNNILLPSLDTVFIPSKQEYSHINSTVVREMIKYNKDLGCYLPSKVVEFIRRKRDM